MLKRTLTYAALTMAIAAPTQAEESPISYTYVGASYQMVDVDGEDFGGFGIAGSAALNETVYAIASYAKATSDDEYDIGFGPDELELDQLSLGFGFHTPINERADFTASISYVDVELEYLGESVDGDGFQIDAGVRGKPSENFEFGGFINHADIEDESDTGFTLAARVFADEKISFGGSFSSMDDVDTIAFSVRFDL